jgi:hypothetical protein
MSFEGMLAVVGTVVALVTIASSVQGRAIEQRTATERGVLACVVVLLSIALIAALRGKPSDGVRGTPQGPSSKEVETSSSAEPMAVTDASTPTSGVEQPTESNREAAQEDPPTRPVERSSYEADPDVNCEYDGGVWRPCVPPATGVRIDRAIAWSGHPVKSGNVRAGPGTGYPIVAVVVPYDVVRVVGKVEERGWYLIRDDIASTPGYPVPAYIKQYYPDASDAEVYVSGELLSASGQLPRR